MDDVTANTDVATDSTSISNYFNGLTAPRYGTVVSGNKITRKIKNLTVSNVGTSLRIAQNMKGGSNKAEAKFGSDIVLGTAESQIEGTAGPWTYEYAFWGLILWMGSSIPAGAEIEFDIEVYVGDVRYI